MTEAGRLQAILDTLNAYEAEGGKNIWRDVIYHLPELNEGATDAFGSFDRGDCMILELDDEWVEVYYDYLRGQWVTDR